MSSDPIDRLFLQLATLYGKHWLDMWEGIPMPQVKATWASALAHVSGDQVISAIAYLTHSSKFPPTCPEFVAICRQFSGREPERQQRLTAPIKAGGDIAPRTRAVIEHLHGHGENDPKRWAREILREAAAGTYRSTVGIAGAREALGLNRRDEVQAPPQADDERAAIQQEGA